jgi:hypothetical protein
MAKAPGTKTAVNSFGSDQDSGIIIWKHNTMGHMDNSIEEAIARLIKKQQEGLVNSESQVSFASEVRSSLFSTVLHLRSKCRLVFFLSFCGQLLFPFRYQALVSSSRGSAICFEVRVLCSFPASFPFPLFLFLFVFSKQADKAAGEARQFAVAGLLGF